MSFRLALSRTAVHEGGYVNDPRDPGGETMYGITRRVARKWGYKGEMRFLPKALSEEIFEKEYWLPIKGPELPFPLAYQLFDTCVHSGDPQTTRLLQSVLGLKTDGIFGSLTLSAALNSDPIETAKKFLLNRHEFQRKLPTWAAFSAGWARRNVENAFFLCEDAFNHRNLQT